MINKLINNPDVPAGFGISASMLSSPIWLAAVTDVLQAFTMLIGIIVGISAYRLNTARREKLKEKD